MLKAEQNGQNFANILNDQKLRSEFIEAILTPKQRLDNTSVLQKYLKYLNDSNIPLENKQQTMKALMNTLFSSDP